jgi:membrane glycosyltransferase
MQYLRLLGMPGLLPMSRFQLIWAVSMFIGAPAWTMILALAPFVALGKQTDDFPAASLVMLYLLFLGFYLAPKLAGVIEVALTPGALTRYGGALRFFAAALIEAISSFIIGAVTTLSVSLFLIGRPFGVTIEWGGQARDVRGLSWRAAARMFWPHLLFGVCLFGVGLSVAPRLVLWSLPLTVGYLAAIPFAVFTASPRIGAWLARIGLFATPEELKPPEIFSTRRGAQEERQAAKAEADAA